MWPFSWICILFNSAFYETPNQIDKTPIGMLYALALYMYMYMYLDIQSTFPESKNHHIFILDDGSTHV